MRKFEKISFDQFKKDIADDKELYDSYEIPSRDTYYAAGYDFHALTDFVIHPGEIKKIPTGIKASMEDDEVLLLMVRSSQGFRFNIRLINQVGVVDKDYYNNPTNEGEIGFMFYNFTSEIAIIKKGEKLGQGLFEKYLKADNDIHGGKRISGFGSTGL